MSIDCDLEEWLLVYRLDKSLQMVLLMLQEVDMVLARSAAHRLGFGVVSFDLAELCC